MKNKILTKLMELESQKNSEQDQEILDTVIDMVLNLNTYL